MSDTPVMLTWREAALFCDLLNGTLTLDWDEKQSAAYLRLEYEDGIKLTQLDEKWEVDAQALREKLQSFDVGDVKAVIAGVERFWTDDQPVMTREGVLRAFRGWIREE